MTQDLHSNGNSDDDDIDDEFAYVAPKCPECGGELEYFDSAKYRLTFIKDGHNAFFVMSYCEACKFDRGIIVTVLDD